VKRCPKCGQLLAIEHFASRGNDKGKTSYCRACQSQYGKAHYRRNAALHNRRRYLNQKQYRKRNAELLRRYLLARACIDCGETDVRVLEFDHVRGRKVDNIGTMCAHGCGWQRIAAEIAKCEIRCANCHRRRTAGQFGWWQNVGT
jgi:hypothetical protein